MPSKNAPQVKSPVDASFSRQEVELIKDTCCKGATDEEFKVFLHVCNHHKLDPLMRQIHSVPRWDSQLKRMVRTTQVSFHGKLLIAERTKRYMPGPKPDFTYDENGKLESCTAYIQKLDDLGQWHIVAGHVLYRECVQLNKEGKPSGLWGSKDHRMLSKCALSYAFDLAFPADMSMLYIHEEMGDAEIVESPKTLEPGQIDQLEHLIGIVPDFRERIMAAYEVEDLRHIKAEQFEKIKGRLEQIIDQRKAEGKLEQTSENISYDEVEELS